MNETTGATTSDCHRKLMENLVGMKHLIFCSDYNMPTLFRNQHTGGLYRAKSVGLLNTLHIMVYGQSFRIIP